MKKITFIIVLALGAFSVNAQNFDTKYRELEKNNYQMFRSVAQMDYCVTVYAQTVESIKEAVKLSYIDSTKREKCLTDIMNLRKDLDSLSEDYLVYVESFYALINWIIVEKNWVDLEMIKNLSQTSQLDWRIYESSLKTMGLFGQKFSNEKVSPNTARLNKLVEETNKYLEATNRY